MINKDFELMREQRELEKKGDVMDIHNNIMHQQSIVAKVNTQIDLLTQRKAQGDVTAAELRHINIQVS